MPAPRRCPPPRSPACPSPPSAAVTPFVGDAGFDPISPVLRGRKTSSRRSTLPARPAGGRRGPVGGEPSPRGGGPARQGAGVPPLGGRHGLRGPGEALLRSTA